MNKILEGRCGAIFVRIADVADFTCLVRFCRRIGLEAEQVHQFQPRH